MMSSAAFDIVGATIAETSEAIRSRRVSPVELTAATLARIEALQPRLQCFTTLTTDYAMQRAREAEREVMQGRYRGRYTAYLTH